MSDSWGFRIFSFRFKQKRKIPGLGERQILVSNGNVRSRAGDEGEVDTTLTPVAVEFWDPTWPWGASPGPEEMKALLCFKSVLKKGHPLRTLTKLINECRGHGWIHP